jgi:hypothetical protein
MPSSIDWPNASSVLRHRNKHNPYHFHRVSNTSTTDVYYQNSLPQPTRPEQLYHHHHHHPLCVS